MSAGTPQPGTESACDSLKSGRTRDRKQEMRRQHQEWLELAGKQVMENIARLRAKAAQERKERDR